MLFVFYDWDWSTITAVHECNIISEGYIVELGRYRLCRYENSQIFLRLKNWWFHSLASKMLKVFSIFWFWLWRPNSTINIIYDVQAVELSVLVFLPFSRCSRWPVTLKWQTKSSASGLERCNDVPHYQMGYSVLFVYFSRQTVRKDIIKYKKLPIFLLSPVQYWCIEKLTSNADNDTIPITSISVMYQQYFNIVTQLYYI